MPEKNYTILLNHNTRILVYIQTAKGNIVNFVVKLEILIDAKWVEIERYDTHHGYVHKDIIDKEGKKKRVVKYDLIDKES